MRIGILLLAAGSLLAESVAGLSWTAPEGWISKGASPMRAATYAVADAECVVYFFGLGQGGSAQANIDRWKSQFTLDGKPAPAKVWTNLMGALSVTNIDVTGSYTGMDGAATSGTRMIAAIIEGPGGNIFLKFTGPAKTIAANQAKFARLLASFHRS